MSQYLPLSPQNVDFILELFDSGATIHQILDEFYKRGQVGVQFVTIQRCLIEHGRGMTLYKIKTQFLLTKATSSFKHSYYTICHVSFQLKSVWDCFQSLGPTIGPTAL